MTAVMIRIRIDEEDAVRPIVPTVGSGSVLVNTDIELVAATSDAAAKAAGAFHDLAELLLQKETGNG